VLEIHGAVVFDSLDFAGFALAHHTELLLLFSFLHGLEDSLDHWLDSLVHHFLQLLSSIFQVIRLCAKLCLALTLRRHKQLPFLIDRVGVEFLRSLHRFLTKPLGSKQGNAHISLGIHLVHVLSAGS